MKTVLFITLVAMVEVLVSGFVMPNEAVPLGTWRRTEKIEWEVADLDLEEDDDDLNIQNYIEKNPNLIVVKDRYIYSDGGESINTHSSYRPMLRYQQEVTFYTNNSKVEEQQSDLIRNLLFFLIVIKLMFVAFFVFRYLKNKSERNSIQSDQIHEETIESIEYRIRSHQYQIDHLRRYFLQHQQPIHGFIGYHQPQQYHSSTNSVQSQIQKIQQIIQQPSQIPQNLNDIQIFSGEYESHYVFRRKPDELFQKLKQLLNKQQIPWIVLNKYILQTNAGLKISLQKFEGLQSAFIIVFSQKTQLNNLIITELQL